jgi:hypothetical protein
MYPKVFTLYLCNSIPGDTALQCGQYWLNVDAVAVSEWIFAAVETSYRTFIQCIIF